MRSFLTALALCLTACVSVPVIPPSGPGGDVIAVDATGFTVNAQGYAHMLSEGAKPDMFTVAGTGWHMTNGEYHDFNAIRVK